MIFLCYVDDNELMVCGGQVVLDNGGILNENELCYELTSGAKSWDESSGYSLVGGSILKTVEGTTGNKWAFGLNTTGYYRYRRNEKKLLN